MDAFLNMGFWIILACGAVGVTLAEWWAFLMKTERHPVVYTVTTAALVALACWRGRVWYLQARNAHHGAVGEQAVADLLEELREDGYRIYHDLPGRRGNIDHVLVGPAGIFAVETKTRSKRGDDKIEYDGERLRIGGFDEGDRILGQARAARSELAERLKSATGRHPARVRAVVLFPGWWVDECSGAEVWVLNPDGRLRSWLMAEAKHKGAIPEIDLVAAAAVLDVWCREPYSVDGH